MNGNRRRRRTPSEPSVASPRGPAEIKRHRPGGARRPADWLIPTGLAVVTFLLYARTFSYGFIEYDDPKYIGEPLVQQGLTLTGVVWAFTTTAFANWLPVTWLSHMLDCQLYGLRGGGHHATSAALHAANAALVFLVLRAMTGARWRSAAVAGFFAVHPLRVESVAWIAERKDVLSATFFLLILLAYPNAHQNYGVSLDRLGRTDEAIDQYRQVIRLNPKLAVARYTLAVDLAKRKEYPAAEAEFAAAAALSPENPDVNAEWGQALLDHGRYPEAAARFAAVLRLDPNHPTAAAGAAASGIPTVGQGKR